jgi:hypothetical protein
LPSQFIWDENSNDRFLLSLSTPDAKQQCYNFMQREIECTDVGIDDAVSNVNKLLNFVTKGVIKKRQIKRSNHKRHFKRFKFNESCCNIRRQLHYVKNLKQRYPHNREIKEQFYEIKRVFEKSVKKNKSDVKEELLDKLNSFHDKDTQEYWNIFNQLRNNRALKRDCPISADHWVKYYKGLYHKAPDLDNDIIMQLKEAEINNVHNTSLDYDVTEKEMYDMIKSLKCKKAPGPDGIINEMLKCGKFYLVPIVQKLFNHIIQSGFFPKQWKKGFIINIHKDGVISEPNNYRGITLSSCLGKVFSLIMNARLVEFLNVKGIYSECQFGFRKDRRTTDSIYIIEKLMSHYRNVKKKLYIGFIDFLKVFDKVWRSALMYKLLNVGIGGRFYNILKNMYTDNVSAVKLNGAHTEYFDCSIGVRQGDGLSPTLFNVFINDVQSMFNADDSTPARYGNVKLGCLIYADDLVILSESPLGIQNSLNKLAMYCKRWKLEINISKSKIMIASSRTTKTDYIFTINGNELEKVKRYKYLGMYLSCNGSMQYAQEYLSDRAVKAWFSIRNGLYNQKVWPVNIYVKSFDTVIKPVALYGCEIWGQNIINTKDTKKYCMPKFDVSVPCERLHVKVCKQILRVPKKATNIAVLSELGRLPMYHDILSSMARYYARLESLTDNSLLKQVFTTSKILDNRTCIIMRYVESQLNYNSEHINFKVKSLCKTYVKDMKKHLKLYFENSFFSFMKSDSNKKLSTYKHIKNEYCRESYLACITDPYIRKEVTCLRISSHGLRIETGRYKNIDRENRICLICDTGVIEDELHFMMDCSKYRELRNKYLYPILLKLSNIYNYNEWEMFVNILSSTDKNVIISVANYIHNAMIERNNYVIKVM